MIGLALWQTATLSDAFGLPRALAQVTPDRPVAATFGNGPQLAGVDLPAGAALAPGESLPVTLYWTTGPVMREDYTLFVHLATPDDRLLAQFDGVADNGRHPTRQWRPGEVFADAHTLTLSQDAPLGLASLSVGWYPIDDVNARLPVTGPTGAEIGDRLVIARVAVVEPAAGPRPALPAPVAVWSNGITLARATVTQGDHGPAGASLVWWSAATLHQDYTLFVQALDADNRVLAQQDQEPQRPTSTWRLGDEVSAAVTWPDAETGSWTRVIAGWYGSDGARLPLTDGQDHVVLAARETP
jgi:hypothetical protein